MNQGHVSHIPTPENAGHNSPLGMPACICATCSPFVAGGRINSTESRPRRYMRLRQTQGLDLKSSTERQLRHLRQMSLCRPQGSQYHVVGLDAIWSRTLALLLSFQSPRAICSARAMQVSLGGRPHRSDRSQSPQVKSASRRIAPILLETSVKMPRMALDRPISSSCHRIFGQKIDLLPLPRCIDQDQRASNSRVAGPQITDAFS